jgi:hypothetical protein
MLLILKIGERKRSEKVSLRLGLFDFQSSAGASSAPARKSKRPFRDAE